MELIEVLVGRIGKPHGIRGFVTVEARTDEPDRRFAEGAVLRTQPPKGSAYAAKQLTVEGARWHGQVLQVAFEEIADRNEAEAARGTLLFADVPAEESPEDPDEYYDHQLIGLTAFDEAGRELGTVKSLVHGGAQDLLTIRTPDRRDALVPFVKALVPVVDLAEKKVVIADRPGLVTPFPEDEDDTK
ncbi:MAG: ribosome maturation factor RimM [Nocardioides sp.]|uniref:ribosome maturation factor RimM n=1 Tax=Nocardioides sp. TaxID=35761 RepID=UPI003D6ACF29